MTFEPKFGCCTLAIHAAQTINDQVSVVTSNLHKLVDIGNRFHTHICREPHLSEVPDVAARCRLVCLRSLLAVQTGKTLHICQRGVLQRRTCGSLAAAQLSSHDVAVESISGAATINIKANLQVRGDLRVVCYSVSHEGLLPY